MTKTLIVAAVVSNYAGMNAMIGTDGLVYLGKRENYHSCIGENSPAYYDNSDGSLQFISSNENMFSFLYGEGWTLSQRQMRREHYFTKADYIEFAGLRDGVLSKYQLVREVTFAGKPFVPPKPTAAEKGNSQPPCERNDDMPEEKKYIRFINSDYKTLFYLPDGGRIRITYPDGKQLDKVCSFIDEYHTRIGFFHYHICEFAEKMEKIGAKYEPLDYIREPEFYREVLMTRVAGIEAPARVKHPSYYVIDETDDLGFAFAPKGAPKGRRYCIFKKLPDEYNRRGYRIGEVLCWSGTLRDIYPKDYGFNVAKIKAAAQRPKARNQPQR